MKRALLIIALAIPAVSSATENNCPFIAKMAESTMQLRQVGTPLGRALEISPAILKPMVLDAYSFPRYATSDAQTRAIQDFRNVWELTCYKGQK